MEAWDQVRERRASGMTPCGGRSLPGNRGEQVSSEARERTPSSLSLRSSIGRRGLFFPERNHGSGAGSNAWSRLPFCSKLIAPRSPSSFRLSLLTATMMAMVIGTIMAITVPAAATDVISSAPTGSEAAPTNGGMNALTDFERVIATRYQLADLKVDWTLGSSLARELGGLEGATARSTQPLPNDCPDKVVARLQGTREGRSVDLIIPGLLQVSGLANRALRPLASGALVSARDVESVQTWVPPSARCSAEVEGLFLSKAVAAGDWIPCASLREPPSIRRNQDLVVVYRAPGLELRGRGVARKDGWLGEEVLVRVSGAERDCRAEVIGPGTVQVGLIHGEAVTR